MFPVENSIACTIYSYFTQLHKITRIRHSLFTIVEVDHNAVVLFNLIDIYKQWINLTDKKIGVIKIKKKKKQHISRQVLSGTN